MTTKTKVLVYCGAVFAATTVGLCLLLAFGGNRDNRWWISGTALTAGWLFAGIGFGPTRWAVTAVPSASLGFYAFSYLRERSLDRQASVLLIVAALASAIHLWNVRRRPA